MTVILVVFVVSGSLVVGAAFGVSGWIHEPVEGFMVALAGGALLVSTGVELLDPATEVVSVRVVGLAVMAGATMFSVLDRIIDARWGGDSGGILLSNLPEAAGGARQMRDDDRSTGAVIGIWVATAALLSVAAFAGYFFLETVPETWLAGVRCFAGGAVVASLATEVFPVAFKEDGYATGVAAALGTVLAVALDQLGS